jgi:hypothetical protein
MRVNLEIAWLPLHTKLCALSSTVHMYKCDSAPASGMHMNAAAWALQASASDDHVYI